METIVLNDCAQVLGAVCIDFWKVSNSQALATWSTDQIVGRMLVSVGSDQSMIDSDFEECVDSQTTVWIKRYTLAIKLGSRKVGRVDSTREDLGAVVVNRLVVDDCYGQ